VFWVVMQPFEVVAFRWMDEMAMPSQAAESRQGAIGAIIGTIVQ
jgi:hypothetical protein